MVDGGPGGAETLFVFGKNGDVHSAARMIMHVLYGHWPQMYVEALVDEKKWTDFDEDDRHDPSFIRWNSIPFNREPEIFVYRDKKAEELWEKEGGTKRCQNLMFHIIISEKKDNLLKAKYISIVYGWPASKRTVSILKDISDTMKTNAKNIGFQKLYEDGVLPHLF